MVKKWLESKPFWVVGLIVGFSIGILFYLIQAMLSSLCSVSKNSLCVGLSFSSLSFIQHLFFIFGPLGNLKIYDEKSLFIVFVIDLIFFAIIGFILGLILHSFKERK